MIATPEKKIIKEISGQELLQYLPHRPPFLFVDRVIEIEPGKSLTAIKNVSHNEYFFAGHFPKRPIMPGVLILEALAQASTVLAFVTVGIQPDNKDLYLFAALDHVKFRRMVQPGDQLQLKVELAKARQGTTEIKRVMKTLGTALVDGKIVCSAELLSIKINS